MKTMRRREFLKSAAIAAVGAYGYQSQKQVAITMDDFNLFGAPEAVASKRNRAILDALKRHSDVKATIFVTGSNVDHPLGKRLLSEWNDAGHMIGNHTYSHRNYATSNFDEYCRDIMRNDELLKGYSQFRRYFRFPMLKEGATAEQRDRMRAFLSKNGYSMGYVTIDNSDWYIDTRLRERIAKAPNGDTSSYRNYYLEHVMDRAAYYDKLAHETEGRQIKHTLLIHHNVLNGMYLGDLMDRFEKQGWKFINAEEAYRDPVFKELPKTVPAGESIVWARAKEKGKLAPSLRYPAEDGDYIKAEMDKLGL